MFCCWASTQVTRPGTRPERVCSAGRKNGDSYGSHFWRDISPSLFQLSVDCGAGQQEGDCVLPFSGAEISRSRNLLRTKNHQHQIGQGTCMVFGFCQSHLELFYKLKSKGTISSQLGQGKERKSAERGMRKHTKNSMDKALVLAPLCILDLSPRK